MSHAGRALVPLDARDVRLDALADALATSSHNLVAAGERPVIRTRHVGEARALAEALADAVMPGSRWVDLGTGGGLPGLVLAMAYPSVEWILVDSVRKKATAVKGFARELGIDNVTVLAERAEALARTDSHRGTAAGVVARAVAPLRVLAELARGFVDDGGWVAALKGPGWVQELADAKRALERCAWSDARGVRLASPSRTTWLVTMRAVGRPPVDIPRRPGVPRRRPF